MSKRPARLHRSLVVALMLWPLLAGADPRSEANEHFQAGLRLFRQNDFARARQAFARAYEILPDARVLANEAACYDAEGRPVDAARTYRLFLDRAGSNVSDEALRKAEREIARLRPMIGELAIATTPNGAEVRVDGELVGSSPIRWPIAVRPGARIVEVRADGHAPLSRSVTVMMGQSESLTLILSPLPARISEREAQPARSPPRPDEPAPDRRASAGPPAAFWVGLTLTGALLTAAAVTGGLALSSKSDHDQATGARRDDLRRQTRALSIATDVLLDTAAVGALVTLGVFIFGGPSERAEAEARLTQGRLEPMSLSF
jgi:tetratricopeptide (TPR) repeat protein